MRIIILCLSPSRGGLELYALEEIRKLQNKGHQCMAVVSENSYLAEALSKENIPVALVRVWFTNLPLIAAIRLAKHIEEFNADIVHIHWGQDLYLAGLAKAKSRIKVSLVYTRHMNYTREKKDIYHRWFYERVDLLLVGTHLLQQLAIQYLPVKPDNIKLLYIGVDKPLNKQLDCHAFYNDQFIKRKLNIAVFGRVEHGKGQHVMVRSIKELVAEDYDISLVLVGHTMDQKYQQELESLISNNKLNDRIQFKGFVDNVADSMKCFDVIALTTLCETFGLVLVEAMRAGVAVVGTNAGGVPEIIEDAQSGLLIEPDDIQSTKQALIRLYNNPALLTELAEKGRQRADNLFDSSKHFDQLEQILQDGT